MAKGIRFDLASGKRIARSVRHTEQDFREIVGKKRPPGQILNQGGMTRWGKLDADLAYNNTTGVAFSIWELDGTIAWVDTTDNLDLVFPPFELAHAMVPSGVKVEVTQRGGKWYVSKFPHVYEGTLAEDLTVAGGTADVTVSGDTFEDCKKPNTLAATITSGKAVTITLESDGYYHITLAPC